MAELIPEIREFIEKALAYLNLYFKNNMETNEIGLFEVYPYVFDNYKMADASYEERDVFDYLGILYESLVPINIKKDLGQFYTRKDAVIEMMVNSVDVLAGKILEPSCGSGLFLVKIIDKIVFELQHKGIPTEEILNYICDNIHANDYDSNALIITEINVLAKLLPLIINVRKKNPSYTMKPLNITGFDFTKKDILKKEYSLVIGNPPFITMYGKRSRK